MGSRVGDRPIRRLPLWIVGPREFPGRCGAPLFRQIAPTIGARFPGRRRIVELPQFLARLRVVRREEAAGANLTGPVTDELVIRNHQAAGVFGAVGVIMRLGLPSNRSGAGIQRDEVAVGCGEIDQVLEYREVLRSRQSCGANRPCHLLWVCAPIIPDQVAIGAVKRLNAAARRDNIHHALTDDRGQFLRALRKATDPGHTQLADIGAVDFFERANPLLVIGAVEHQPVRRIGIGKNLLGHCAELGGLGRASDRKSTYRENEKRCEEARHGVPPTCPTYKRELLTAAINRLHPEAKGCTVRLQRNLKTLQTSSRVQ